ncbi:MAG: hypothetical protein ABJK37_10885, partial [Paraglaciecola sp.]|uniref:hypothetical protein n=1 Tax=Paraglaciecola sp. TaxID=1920173 RepID=UPI003296BA6C
PSVSIDKAPSNTFKFFIVLFLSAYLEFKHYTATAYLTCLLSNNSANVLTNKAQIGPKINLTYKSITYSFFNK